MTIASFCLFLLELANIIMIKTLISYFDLRIKNTDNLIQIVFMLFMFKFSSSMLGKQYEIFVSDTSIKSNFKLLTFMFEKILKTSSASNKKVSSQAEIINYILIDSIKLESTMAIVPAIILSPIKIIIYVFMLYYYLGISSIFGLIPIVAVLMIIRYLFKDLPLLCGDYLQKKNERVRNILETLDKLRMLKMYAWENIFERKVNNELIMNKCIQIYKSK